MRIFATALVLVCLLSPHATLATIVDVHVTSPADNGPGTLRQAILDGNAMAANNDVPNILIDLDSSQPITLASPLPTINSVYCTINGTQAEPATIDGGNTHPLLHTSSSVLLFGLNNVALLNGLTTSLLTSACLSMDIPANPGHATLEKVEFRSCKQFVDGPASGAAIFTGHALTIKDAYFSGNESHSSSSAWGGAIRAINSVHVSNSHFADNIAIATSSARGGAIKLNGSDKALTVIDSVFVDNGTTALSQTGTAYGGAIDVTGDSDVLIEHSSFLSNSASAPNHSGFSYGGAVASSGIKGMQITRSSLSANGADHGGAIYHFQDDAPAEVDLDVRNTSFILNQARLGDGGAINTTRGRLSLRNNSFWRNQAANGNNLANRTSSSLVHVWNNLFDAGIGMGTACQGFLSSGPTSAGYNILPDGDCGLGSGPGDLITDNLGIIGLKVEANSIAVPWLVQDSPAIDRGNPADPDDEDPAACLEQDAHGTVRPVIGVGWDPTGPPMMLRCDIGAWESPGEAPLFHGDFDDPLLGYGLD